MKTVKKTANKTKLVGVRVPKPLWQQIRKICKDENLNLAEMLRQYLKAVVAAKGVR